jgi:hypothetical protein
MDKHEVRKEILISRLSWPTTAIFTIFGVLLSVFGWIGIREIEILDRVVSAETEHEKQPYHTGTKLILETFQKTTDRIESDIKDIKSDLKKHTNKSGD